MNGKNIKSGESLFTFLSLFPLRSFLLAYLTLPISLSFSLLLPLSLSLFPLSCLSFSPLSSLSLSSLLPVFLLSLPSLSPLIRHCLQKGGETEGKLPPLTGTLPHLFPASPAPRSPETPATPAQTPGKLTQTPSPSVCVFLCSCACFLVYFSVNCV